MRVDRLIVTPEAGLWYREICKLGWSCDRDNRGMVTPDKYREDLIFVNPAKTIAVNLIFMDGVLCVASSCGKAELNGKFYGWFGPCDDEWKMNFAAVSADKNAVNLLTDRLNAWLKANS